MPSGLVLVHSYGLPVQTPNLDRLRQKSLLYEHAYCQLSVCAPSRMSFMTSLRPDTNQVWNFIDTNPTTSLATPGWFRHFNYLTYGLGKTFHQDAGAWNSDAYWSPDFPYYPYTAGKCPCVKKMAWPVFTFALPVTAMGGNGDSLPIVTSALSLHDLSQQQSPPPVPPPSLPSLAFPQNFSPCIFSLPVQTWRPGWRPMRRAG